MKQFFRFHPLTGQDANDFPTDTLSVEERQELASMVAHGAKFYWELETPERPGTVEGYSRVEYSNVKFVLHITATPHEFVDSRP